MEPVSDSPPTKKRDSIIGRRLSQLEGALGGTASSDSAGGGGHGNGASSSESDDDAFAPRSTGSTSSWGPSFPGAANDQEDPFGSPSAHNTGSSDPFGSPSAHGQGSNSGGFAAFSSASEAQDPFSAPHPSQQGHQRQGQGNSTSAFGSDPFGSTPTTAVANPAPASSVSAACKFNGGPGKACAKKAASGSPYCTGHTCPTCDQPKSSRAESCDKCDGGGGSGGGGGGTKGRATLPLAAPLPLPWLASIGYLLDPRALSDVGLFRVPGSKKEVDDLLAVLHPNANPSVDALRGCFDPNAVASLIKRLMVESSPRQPLDEYQVSPAFYDHPTPTPPHSVLLSTRSTRYSTWSTTLCTLRAPATHIPSSIRCAFFSDSIFILSFPRSSFLLCHVHIGLSHKNVLLSCVHSFQAAELGRVWETDPTDVASVAGVISRLPDESYSILWGMFYLFEAVLANCETNRMDSNALGVSIGPTVFAGCVRACVRARMHVRVHDAFLYS
jgi:hypothetical protein